MEVSRYCTLIYFIFLFLVLASISSDLNSDSESGIGSSISSDTDSQHSEGSESDEEVPENYNLKPQLSISLPNIHSRTYIGVSENYSLTFEQAETDEGLVVQPSDLKNLILSREKEVAMTIFLVLIHGLPHSGKSGVFQKFLEKIPNAHIARPQHGLSFYELAAVENAESGRLHIPTLMYSSVTATKDCYDKYAMKSAMKQVATGKKIKYMGGLNIKNSGVFSNKDLNAHFHDLFLDLEQEAVSTWGGQGIAIFNIWDIGHSHTVHHFLPALHGLLHNSYSWLFFDLERDSRALYKPPEASPKVQCKPSEALHTGNLMKYRPRLHHLMHCAKLNVPAEKKVCLLFATHDGQLAEKERRELVQSIKPALENAATQIGVKEVIDFNVIPIKPDDDEKCVRLITEKLDKLVYKALKSTFTMPFSFIFLRSFYYKNDNMVYIKKKEIQKVADELEISEEELNYFCKLFTSFGSIIDVSLIDPTSEYVILKPNLFIDELDEKIFHTKDNMLANKGILTPSVAQNLFGSMDAAYVYTDILVSLKLAAKLSYENVEIALPLDSKTDVFYLPEIRTTQPLPDTTKLRRSALQLRGWNAPPDHLHTSFVAKFLSRNPHTKVCICNDTPTNVTKIEAIDSSSQAKVKFDVVYFEYTLEFRAETSSKEVFSHIIASCHEVMKEQKNVQYDFAILCSKNPSSTDAEYELKRERHLLPYNTLCDVCSNDKRYEDPILMVWNELLEVSQNTGLSNINVIIGKTSFS